MPHRPIRQLDALLDSANDEERRAGLILVNNYNWKKAVEVWIKAVEYTLASRAAAGNVDRAEALAVDQINTAITQGQPLDLPEYGGQTNPNTDKDENRRALQGVISRIAICGNPYGSEHEQTALDLIYEVARVVARFQCIIVHGPRGAGIMVANLCHNQFQAQMIESDLVFVDRARIVGDAQMVLVIAGGPMTGVEIDIAIQHERIIAPFPGTGGQADRLAAKIRSGKAGYYVHPRILQLVNIDDMDEQGRWLSGSLKEGFET